MTPAYQSLVRHLDEHEFHYQGDPDKGCIRAIFGGKHGAYHLVGRVDEQLFQVFAHSGIHVPEGARSQIAEVICRANYGLKLGKIEMDMDDGELRYQAATCLADNELTEDMIRFVISATVVTLDRYMPAILSCIYGNEEPSKAVRHAEVQSMGETRLGRKPSGM